VVCLLQGLKLQIYRLRRPELLSWVSLIPLKLPVRLSPGGLEKKPIFGGFLLGIFILDILLPLFYIRLILSFPVFLAETDIQGFSPLAMEFTELTVLVSVGVGLFISVPKEHQGYAFFLRSW